MAVCLIVKIADLCFVHQLIHWLVNLNRTQHHCHHVECVFVRWGGLSVYVPACVSRLECVSICDPSCVVSIGLYHSRDLSLPLHSVT